MSYSYASVSCDHLKITPKDLARPVLYSDLYDPHVPSDIKVKNKPLVLIAGEGTSQHYFSTAHGAYDEGETQANAIIKFRNRSLPEV